jgi:ParB-like chromosome segregation protein Spo0J
VSHAELLEDLALPADATWVPVAELDRGSPFRSGGLCPEQVDRLVALGGAWPPVLVHARDGSLIDGAHRVAAARRLGMARLEVERFAGSAEEAFVEFVRRNVAHGLTLSLAERKRAADRVLREHPEWSDRRVAELCALSPKTVGRRRAEGHPAGDGDGTDDRRLGRDGRLRPAHNGSARARVLDALGVEPDASLRTLAAMAGVSPETVRLVRLNLAEAPPAPPDDEPAVAPEPVPAPWHGDTALATSASGEDFVAWFERTAVDDDDLDRAAGVPLGRVYVVADEARRRSETWLQIARTLEARPGRGR